MSRNCTWNFIVSRKKQTRTSRIEANIFANLELSESLDHVEFEATGPGHWFGQSRIACTEAQIKH